MFSLNATYPFLYPHIVSLATDSVKMPGDDDTGIDLTDLLTKFGDKLSTTVAQATGANDDLLDKQAKNFQRMQDLHEQRTDKILNTLQAAAAAPNGNNLGLARRKDTEPPILSEVDPIKWNSFRKCYNTISKLNKWDDDYSVQRLSTCIREQAARAIGHLSWDTFQDLESAFAAIEQVYLNPAGIEFFKATFRLSNREAHENFLQWHTRCRELFIRAYPTVTDPEKNDDLKERFIMGLRDRNLAAQIKISDNYDSWTYTDLLNRAQKIYGNTLIVHSAYSNKPIPSDGISSIALADLEKDQPDQEPVIQAINTRKPNSDNSYKNIKCHFCGKLGHVVSRCFAKQRIDRQNGQRPSQPGGQPPRTDNQGGPSTFAPYSGQANRHGNFNPRNTNFRGRGNRGRGRKQGRKYGQRPGVNALQEYYEEEAEEDDLERELYDELSPTLEDIDAEN